MSKVFRNHAAKLPTLSESVPPVTSLPKATQGQRHKRLTPAERFAEEARALGFAQGLEEGRTQGLRDGFEEGFKAGYGEGGARVEELIQGLNELFQSCSMAREEWLLETERQLLGLSVVIAERILQKELALTPEATLSIVRASLKEVTHTAKARIRVNPLFSEALRKRQSEFEAIAPSLRQIEIVPDSGIDGGCIIDTEGGLVEATVKAQLERSLGAIRRAA